MINKNLIKHFVIPLKCFLTVKIGSYNLSVCIISPAYFDLGRLGCASCSSSTLIDSFHLILHLFRCSVFHSTFKFFLQGFLWFFLAFGESTFSALIQLLSVVSLIFTSKSLYTISQK